MSEKGTVPLGATKDKLAWFVNLPSSFSPALRARHYVPSGFGQKITPLSIGDAYLAPEMYARRFTFAGQTILASPSDIFAQDKAKPKWLEAMARVDWLAHFNASNSNLHDHYAMRLLYYWSISKRPKFDAEVQTKTVIALATDGQMIAKRCETSVQTHYFEIIAHEIKNLVRLRTHNAEQSLAKATALLYCLNSFQGLGHFREMAFEMIARNIDLVILPDGGHVSRSSQKLIRFLEMLVPLHMLRSPVMPPVLTRATESGLAMLKMLQCPDGQLSGQWDEQDSEDRVSRLLDRQKNEIPNLSFAPDSGFARIEHDKTTLIADTSSKLALDLFDQKQKLLQIQNLESGPMRPAIMQNAPQGTVLMMQNIDQKRTCFLSADGQDLRIEDEFGGGETGEIIIKVTPSIRLSSLMEGQAVMFVLPDQSVWHLKQRGGTVHIRQSQRRSEILIERHHSKINWSLKKQPKAAKSPRKKPSFEIGLLI